MKQPVEVNRQDIRSHEGFKETKNGKMTHTGSTCIACIFSGPDP